MERSKAEGAEGAEVTGATRLSRLNQLTEQIIGAAIEVHRQTGPGLTESVYAECLCYELSKRVGLLINFNEPVLTQGLKRLVNHFREPAKAPVTSAPSAFSDLDLSFLTLRLCVSAVK